jgi:hypothetical protein
MTNKSVRKLSTRIASSAGSSWTLWGPVITFWCLNSAMLLTFSAARGNFLLGVAANILPAGILAAIIVGWQAATQRTQRIPAVVVFAIGALLGAAKGIATYLSLWVLSGSNVPIPGFVENTVSATFIGLWLLPTMGVIGSVLREFENERELLMSETVSQRLVDASTPKLDQNIAAFVAQGRRMLRSSAHSTEELKSALTHLAQTDARATSHRLWEQASVRIGTFRLRDLIAATILAHRFPAGLSSAAIFISLYASQAPMVGGGEALWRSAVQSAVAFVVFTLGRLLRSSRRTVAIVVFFSVPAVATLAIDIASRVLFAPNPSVNLWVADTMIFVALTANALIFGVFFMAKSTHEEIRDELNALSAGRMNSEADEAVRLIRRRETAELLHGYVQNQLLAAAARIGNHPASAEEVTSLIEEMLDELEKGTRFGRLANAPTAQHLAETTKELWRGVISVDFTINNKLPWRHNELGLLDRIVNELISNAHRHGLASSISIQLQIEPQTIEIIAEDNGVGPRNGAPGLGSILLIASTEGKWSREASVGGTGTRVQASITRL